MKLPTQYRSTVHACTIAGEFQHRDILAYDLRIYYDLFLLCHVPRFIHHSVIHTNKTKDRDIVNMNFHFDSMLRNAYVSQLVCPLYLAIRFEALILWARPRIFNLIPSLSRLPRSTPHPCLAYPHLCPAGAGASSAVHRGDG